MTRALTSPQLLLCLFLVLPSCISVQPEEAKSSPAADQKAMQQPEKFRPVVPKTQDADWVRLKSGEWLKGELLGLRNESLEFDSDKLDRLTLDWDDVAEVRTPRDMTLLLPHRTIVRGRSLLYRDGIYVLSRNNGGPLRFEDKDVMAVVPRATSEWDYWSGKFSASYQRRTGNTDSQDLSAYVFLRRETADTRFDSDYNGAVSEQNGVENARNHRVSSQFDVFLTDYFYVTPFKYEWRRDRFTNIRNRHTPGAGLGYDLLDRWGMEWSATLALAWIFTEYYSVTPPQELTENEGAWVVGTKYSWDLTSDVEFKLDYQVNVPVEDSANYNHHAKAGLEIDLADDFDLDVAVIWDRVNQPLPDENGITPEQDDFRFTVGIGYSF